MKSSTSKGFSKEISKLMLRRNMESLDQTELNLLSNKMTVDLYVFCTFVIHRICSNVKSCFTVTIEKSCMCMRNKKNP